MTFATVLNIAGGVCFVGAVICAAMSRRVRWSADRSGAALSCVMFALASSGYFIAGAL